MIKALVKKFRSTTNYIRELLQNEKLEIAATSCDAHQYVRLNLPSDVESKSVLIAAAQLDTHVTIESILKGAPIRLYAAQVDAFVHTVEERKFDLLIMDSNFLRCVESTGTEFEIEQVCRNQPILLIDEGLAVSDFQPKRAKNLFRLKAPVKPLAMLLMLNSIFSLTN